MKVNVAARNEITDVQVMAELIADTEKQIVQLVCIAIGLDLALAEHFSTLSEFKHFGYEADIAFIYQRLD